jgi:hypothetical protein
MAYGSSRSRVRRGRAQATFTDIRLRDGARAVQVL